jgi:hypothetical protein
VICCSQLQALMLLVLELLLLLHQCVPPAGAVAWRLQVLVAAPILACAPFTFSWSR